MPSVSSKPQVILPLLYGGGGAGGSPTPQITLTPPNIIPTSTPTTTPTSTPNPIPTPTPTATPSSTPTTTTPSTPPPDITPPSVPILDNLFAEIIYTTSSGANIFGTVSTDTVRVLPYFSATPIVSPPNSVQEGITPSSTRFDFGTMFDPGHNYFYFSALDEANNTSTLSLPAHFVFDTNPPTVPTITIDNQTNASSTNLHLTINSSDTLSPTIFYDVTYHPSTTNTWQDMAVVTTTTQFDFVGVRGQSYLFRSRARDGLGNISLWSDENVSSTPTFVDWSKEVVINEVAWAGNSAQYPNDEWLELYNNTDGPIDLRQWKIMASGRQINWSTVKNSIIPAHGYFLLERTYDNNIRDVAADIIYTLQYGFKNTGEKIELFKPDGIKVDEVDATAGWFAGDNVKYRTMERVSPTKPGNDLSNWQSNRGPRVTPRSYNGGYIYGSPKASNFGFIMLSETQEDVLATLTSANNPYVLIGYSVPVGKTLKIEPGVVIKAYRSAKIEVYGALEARGSVEKPIIFTSGNDQSFANSSFNTIIGTWSAATPLAKDWQGFWFRAGSTGTLEHMELRYAGYDFRPTISNLLSSQALRADSATVNISNSTFNTTGDTVVYLNASTGTVFNSNFQNGVLAVDAQQSDLTLTGSNFTNFSNSRGPVNIKGRWPNLSQLTFSGNALDMAYAESVALEKNTNYPRELDYLVIGGNLQVPSSTTLTLEAGSTLNLAKYSTITVQGVLEAPGTVENPITIQPSSSSTNWGHLKFDGSTSKVSYVNFNRGGLLTGIPADLSGAVLVYNSTVTLDNITVADSRSPGNSIQTGNSTVTIRNSQITKMQKYAGQDTGIKVNSGQLNLDNVLFNNFYIGLLGINNGSLPGLQMSNMSSSSFVNVDYLIQPTNWFSFSTSTP
ncbi:MAG: lamin tail domain-containing protein [Patescibacteria group bacterium]